MSQLLRLHDHNSLLQQTWQRVEILQLSSIVAVSTLCATQTRNLCWVFHRGSGYQGSSPKRSPNAWSGDKDGNEYHAQKKDVCG